VRRRRDVLRESEHQLHERVHARVHVLRVQQGPVRGGTPREAVSAVVGRGGEADERGVGSRRERGVHAGRDPPELHRGGLPRDSARGEARRAGDARARVFAFGSNARREDVRFVHLRLPRRAQSGGVRLAPGHRRGGSPRRRAREDMPGQADVRGVAARRVDRARGRDTDDVDDDVRTRRRGRAGRVGEAPPRAPTRPRLERVEKSSKKGVR
jgi:hypothetical protein